MQAFRRQPVLVSFRCQPSLFSIILIGLGTRIYHDRIELNRIRLEVLCQLYGLIDLGPGFPWESHHKTAVDQDSCFSCIGHEPEHLFLFNALGHGVQGLLLPAFKSDAQGFAPGLLHHGKGLIIRIHP